MVKELFVYETEKKKLEEKGWVTTVLQGPVSIPGDGDMYLVRVEYPDVENDTVMDILGIPSYS